MFQSIRWRIAIPFVLLILVVMGGLGLYLSQFVRQTHLDQLQNQLLGETRLIADAMSGIIAEAPGFNDLDAMALHWAEITNARVTLLAASGEVMGESHDVRAEMDNHLNRLEVQQALRSGFGSSTRFSRTTGYNMMYVAVPVYVDGQISGFARLALPLNEIEANAAHLQRTLLGTTLTAAFMAVALAILIANRTTHPLRHLSQAARAAAAPGEQNASIPASTDEVGQLARAFNLRTQQLQAQMEALRSESLKLEAVLNQMTDGLLIVDSQGRLQLINPSARRMFQIESGEKVINRSLAEVLRHYQIVELWRSCLRSGETQDLSLELGAQRLSLHGHATPLGPAHPGSTLLLFQDLTRIRLLETVRRDFISNISHELRTPLASLKTLTETLQESALEDPPAARRFLTMMDTEVDALSQMVSELLELARIESGKVLLHYKTILPKELIEPAVERMRLQAKRASLSLEIEVADDLPPVLADPPRLQQVLVNLLHNAIKHTPPNGKIRVSAYLENETVVFSVSDTGSGISAEDLPRIFERFYKADQARRSDGIGLGLSIARHLVEAHGGEIWAKSQLGQGSTIYFRLPAFTT
jgi:two-component system, OmpR family, phosphate regulon sensor histidine kinase PhoR